MESGYVCDRLISGSTDARMKSFSPDEYMISSSALSLCESCSILGSGPGPFTPLIFSELWCFVGVFRSCTDENVLWFDSLRTFSPFPLGVPDGFMATFTSSYSLPFMADRLQDSQPQARRLLIDGLLRCSVKWDHVCVCYVSEGESLNSRRC